MKTAKFMSTFPVFNKFDLFQIECQKLIFTHYIFYGGLFNDSNAF